MGKLIKWIKKHVLVTLILSFIITLLPVLVIHILYKLKVPYKFLVTEWSAGELLQFYGSYISFIGTVLLGALALWQNNRLAKENKEYNELIKQQEKQIRIPKFDIPYKKYSCNGAFSNWQIDLKNVSANIAINLSVSLFKVYDKQGNLIEKKSDCLIKHSLLQGGESTIIEFKNKSLPSDYFKVIFFIDYLDIYNDKHKCRIDTEIINQKHDMKFKFTYIE